MPSTFVRFIIWPALLAATAAPAAAAPLGVWQNPRATIRVRTAMCGSNLCGSIVAAAPEARQDARDAGVPNLIGLSLLRSYHLTSPGHWQGHVFVPDMGGVYFSRLVELAPGQIRISGCILGGLLCKSQVWTRV